MGRLTGEVDPGEAGSRVLTSEGDLGEGREDERRGLDSASFLGLLGVSWTDLVSGLVDLDVTLGPLGQFPWKRVRCPMCGLGEGWD